ncbi:hypothetical protein F441_18377 [Phytophthora nicotianae CJ01A1]|uniref:Uncharacterized protein n=1 Tax=Phytophthora nicotianae CJ01A1 TaxID=1317063 RepID=W2W5P7_PHYNI|nr:hypothetical protein F441_18377 [Phytophthora nicotianae CJ01A1]
MGLVLWGVSPFEGNRSDVVPQIGGSDALETKAYYEPRVAPEEHIWEGECLLTELRTGHPRLPANSMWTRSRAA